MADINAAAQTEAPPGLWKGPVVLLLGLLVLAVGVITSTRHHAQWTQARAVTLDAMSQATTVRHAVFRLPYDPGAVEKLRSAQAGWAVDMEVLRRGGHPDPSLGNVFLPANITSALGEADAGFADASRLEAETRPLMAQADSWKSVAAARKAMPGAIARLVGALKNIPSNAATPSTRRWQQPTSWSGFLAIVNAYPPLTKSPSGERARLAKQWIGIIHQSAQNLKSGAPEGWTHQQAQAATAAWVALDGYASAWGKGLALWPQWAQANKAWEDHGDDYVDTMRTWVSAWNIHLAQPLGTFRMVALAGFLVALLGLFLTWSSAARAARAYWRTLRDASSAQQAQQAMIRITTSLRRILHREGTATQITESAQSPGYALASLINRMVSQREEAWTLLRRDETALTDMAVESEALMLNLKRAAERWADLWEQHCARNKENDDLIRTRRQPAHTRLLHAHETLRLALEQSAQQRAKMNQTASRLREQTQAVTKRIKRQGEDAQALGVALEELTEVNGQIRVLALNLAVEAASRDDSDPAAASLASELERLADEVAAHLRDASTRLEDLQENARDAGRASEDNTVLMVALAQPIARAAGIEKEEVGAVEHVDEAASGLRELDDEIAQSRSQEHQDQASWGEDISDWSRTVQRASVHAQEVRRIVHDIRQHLERNDSADL